MEDKTEPFRREAVERINSLVETSDEDKERKRLEDQYGKVYNTQEVTSEFKLEAFMAPYVVCTSRRTKERGTMEFQHQPRLYFNFRPHEG